MITVTAKDAKASARRFKREVKKLERQEVKVAQAANRNVARKSLTQMVREVSKAEKLKQKVVRGAKVTGRASQWGRVKVWAPARNSTNTVSKITFNVSDIPLRHAGKAKQLKRGGVRVGKHASKNSFLGTVAGQKNPAPFVFHRTTSSRYPIDQTVVSIKSTVDRVGSEVSRSAKGPLLIEYERQRRRILNRRKS